VPALKAWNASNEDYSTARFVVMKPTKGWDCRFLTQILDFFSSSAGGANNCSGGVIL
jgi:hypothetical protein